MLRFLSLLLIAAFVIVSCANEDATTDQLLERQPYKPLTDSIKITPQDANMYYRRGSLLYHDNQMLHAEKDMRTAWRLQPTEQHALSLTTILRGKNTDSAITFLHEAIKVLPNSIALRIGLSRGYQQKGHPEKALEICKQITDQYPNQLDALILQSEILKSQNKNAQALAVLEEAYSYAPSDIELAYDLAFEYADAKNSKAIALAELLIKTDSTETVARAYYIKATYFRNVGNSSEAIKNYNTAIVKNYNFLDAYLDKGELLHNEKKYDAALNTFMTALRVSPSTADFYYWIGKIQEATGKKSEAKANYQRAYSLDQSLTEAKKAAERL